MSASAEEHPTLSADEALRVIDEQTAVTAENIGYNDRAAYLVWGFAYLLGYLPLALSVGPSAVLTVPSGAVLAFFAFCIAVGVVYSAVAGARMSRGMRGTSQVRGMLYGWAWTVSLIAAFGLSIRVHASGVESPASGLLVNGIFVLVVAVLFMAGGAIWDDWAQFVIGVLVSVMLTVALIAGLPAYYWIMSLGIGGLLLLAGLFHRQAARALCGRFATSHD